MKDNAPLRYILVTIAVLLALMLIVVVIQLLAPAKEGTPMQPSGLGSTIISSTI